MSAERYPSVPSLVGDSVRSIKGTGTEPVARSDPRNDVKILNKLHDTVANHNQSQQLSGSSYTSVEDLNKEGALLTDEVDLELSHVDGKVQRKDGEVDFNIADRKLGESELEKQRKRKLMLLKQKQKNRELSSTSLSRMDIQSSSSQTSLTHLDDETKEELDRVSRSQERERQRGSQMVSPTRGSDGLVRNSYGEYIKSTCNRPHLARGDSYQSSSNESENILIDSAATPSERSGRTSFRRRLSTEYLRSLSRSLSRDPSKSTTRTNAITPSHSNNAGNYTTSAPPSHHVVAIPGGDFIDNEKTRTVDQSLEDELYSTNNYSISQVELAQAANKTLLNEAFDEEEEEGALLDDQGNEEHDRELERAAIKVEES